MKERTSIIIKLMRGIFLPFLTIISLTSVYNSKYECPIIGIDLGTTSSCVGIYKNGQVYIVPNEFGQRTTPSVVAFTDQALLVGDAAKEKADIKSIKTIYNFKRLIGKKYNDKNVELYKKQVTYEIIDRDGKSYIQVSDARGEAVTFAPQEISAMILKKMKDVTETYSNISIKNAIVTVPTYFGNFQRQLIKEAGTISGLNIVRIMNEPSAAAVAYGLDQYCEKNILVVHLGGRTFDLSVLNIDEYKVIEVVATYGDRDLGGEKFNERVFQYFVEIIQKGNGVDISNDRRAIQTLRKQIQKGKKILSSRNETKIEINDLVEGLHFSQNLSRNIFQEINQDLFQKILQALKLVLQSAEMQANQIDEIVMTGGSTKIPKIRQLVKTFFNGKHPKTDIIPEEAVCYGAALQGSIICGHDYDMGDLGIAYIPLSLGIQTSVGAMNKIIQKGSYVPAKKSLMLIPDNENQEIFTIKVFQGQRPQTKDNYFLGQLALQIPAAPRGKLQIEVTFQVDQDQILSVSAVERVSGNHNSTVIQNYGLLSEQAINEMLREGQEHQDLDQQVKMRLDAMQQLNWKYYYYTRQDTDQKKEEVSDQEL